MNEEDATTVAGAILIVLDIVTVACRFYSRRITKVGFGWDDWTILIAMLAGILPGTLGIWGVSSASSFSSPTHPVEPDSVSLPTDLGSIPVCLEWRGLTRPTHRLASSVSKTGPVAASNFDPDYVYTPADIQYTKIMFSTSFLYFFITCTTKLSLLLLLHRIFAINGSFRVQIYTAEMAVVMFWISATVADLLNCIPLEWTWKNSNADPRYCINYNTFWLVTGIVESVIDLVILALPFGMVFKLHLDRSKKYGVAGIFLLGGFVLFSGVAKVVLSYLPNSRQPNFSRAALWTGVHMYTGIICANLPPSRPLFKRVAR
ncbi:MAG: hypothetical protein Q9210_006433, partial [Variospora velana]